MAKNQKALKRYGIILKTLSRGQKYSSKDLYQVVINSGIEVQYRTIQKDLEDLRDDESIFGRNLGIAEDKKEKKWYSVGVPKEIFSALELRDGEVDALLFYAKTINQYKDYPIFKEIYHALEKVIEGSNISAERKMLFNRKNLIEPEKHPPIRGIEFIIDLLKAISGRRIVNIEYEGFGREAKVHSIKPILLKEDKLMWYLIGVNVKYGQLITFALDRINDVLITDEHFEEVEFDSAEYFKYSFGITVSDEEPIDVVISFNADQGAYIKTLPIHPTQQIIKDTKRELLIKVRVKPSYEFFSKIYSYSDQATIISPDETREIFRKGFENAFSNYK